MNTPHRNVHLRTDTIKGLDPVDQAAVLRELVPQYLTRAVAIRGALETPTQCIVKLRIEGSDEKVVLLALLAAVADDIATIPDAKRISELLATHEKVAIELGLEKADVQFFLRNLISVTSALLG